KFGGMLPYEKLTPILNQADFLLVTTSFEESLKNLVSTSVLTKITDYMIAGKPIISIGPIYSACNRFIEKWKCGYTYSDLKSEKLSKFILDISRDKINNDLISDNALNIVKTHYE